MKKYVLGGVILAELILFVAPTYAFPSFLSRLNLSAVLPGALTVLTNNARAENQAPALSENALLDQAATLKAQDMAAKGYFAHTSPEGKTPWYWFNAVGYHYVYAGENLAVNFTDSADVTAAWMNSPTHRANIVSDHYTEVGTGVATGTYKGREAVFVAQDFGSPRSPGLPANGNSANALSAWQFLILSPHQEVNAVFLALLALTAIVFLIRLVMKGEKRVGEIFGDALLVVAVIFGLYVANNYIVASHTQTSFIAFDATNQILK